MQLPDDSNFISLRYLHSCKLPEVLVRQSRPARM